MKDKDMGFSLIKRGLVENKWDLIEYGSSMLDKRAKEYKILLDGVKRKSIDIVRVGYEAVSGEKISEPETPKTEAPKKKPKFGTGENRFEYRDGVPVVDGYGIGNVPPDPEPKNIPTKFYRPPTHVEKTRSHESIEIGE